VASAPESDPLPKKFTTASHGIFFGQPMWLRAALHGKDLSAEDAPSARATGDVDKSILIGSAVRRELPYTSATIYKDFHLRLDVRINEAAIAA